jgi:hypothetical protein
MRVRENESSLLMARQAERGRFESVQSVALLTAVHIRGGGELGLVLVLMAVQTPVKFEFVNGVFPARNVALRALHGRMFCLQWICSRGVFLHTEERGLESIEVVT